MDSFGDTADTVKSAWQRIVHWLEGNAPAHADALNPPATDEEITATELKMGVRFPVELRAWLLMNNGSTAKHRSIAENAKYDGMLVGDFSFLPSGYLFHDLHLMWANYVNYRHSSIELQAQDNSFEYWKVNWIPVIQKSDAPYGFFLDGASGKEYAPMYLYAEADLPVLCFDSLGVYLERVADALEGVRPYKLIDQGAGVFPVVRDGLLQW